MNFALEQFGRRDGKDAGAGAEIEDGAGPPLARDAIQHVEAAARRTMVAGAESKRGLDLDCDVVGLDRVASMRAMNDEASRPYRLQPFEGSGNPIPFIDAAEGCRAGGGVARGGGDKCANICFARRSAKIGFDVPGTLVRAARVRGFLEGRGGGRGRIKCLDNDGGDPARRRLVAGKTHHMRGAIWGQSLRAWRQVPCKAANGNGELARRRGVPPASLDKALRGAGRALGVPMQGRKT